MATILEVNNLTVRFGRTTVLNQLSFAVERGQSLAIIGPNGAGKTVLLRALIGLVPYEGEVVWADHPRLGYVPQKLDIERDLPITGRDFLTAKARVARASRTAVDQALAQVGLASDAADQLIGTLSGGQFQRLLVACALLGDPDVLLLDEATAGVDEPGQELLYDLVGRLQAERSLTVLLISHELSVVYRHADNVLCLSGARAFVGPPADLTPARLAELYGAEMRLHVHDTAAH